jgi:hypothetical protein
MQLGSYPDLSSFIHHVKRLQVQLLHEKFMHQDRLDHNCHYTIYSIKNTTSFQFQGNKVSRFHGTLNEQPQPLESIHTFVNILLSN